jgi:hypothetical protein
MNVIHPVYKLPYGISIITQVGIENNYVVPRSQIYCFPFAIVDTTKQILVKCGHNLYQGNIDSLFNVYQGSYQNSLRAWISQEPAGLSITSRPYSTNSGINLTGAHSTFNLYDERLPQDQVIPADIVQWVSADVQYYVNVQNRENRDNSLYLELIYN